MAEPAPPPPNLEALRSVLTDRLPPSPPWCAGKPPVPKLRPATEKTDG